MLFSDAEMGKEYLGEDPGWEIKDKIKQIPLSDTTVNVPVKCLENSMC